MRLPEKRNWAVITVTVMAWTFLSPPVSFAQDHVLPLAELQGRLQAAGEARTRNTADIQRVLSGQIARDLLARANASPEQIHKAISTLDDEELSRLADRARTAEQDVEGGFIVGLLALIGLVVVILVVVSVTGT